MKFFRSISNQLSAIVLIVFFIISSTFFIAYYFYTTNIVNKNFTKDINNRTDFLIHSITENLWEMNQNAIKKRVESFYTNPNVISVNIEGVGVHIDQFDKKREENSAYYVAVNKNILYEDAQNKKMLKKIGVLKIIFSNKADIEKNNKIFITFVSISLVLIIFISILVRYVMNYFLNKSFNTFAYGFRKIADNDYDYISTMKENDNIKSEFIPLLYNLNKMSQDLKKQMIEKDKVKQKLIKATNEAIEANNVKDEFLSNTTHEMRTPLHGILSFAKFGISKIDKVEKEKLLYYFEQIRASGEVLLDFQNNILDLSKHQAKKMLYSMNEIDINNPIKTVIGEFTTLLSEKNLKLVYGKDFENETEKTISNLEIVNIDRLKIEQVIRNILSNAIKFSDEGSEINILLGKSKKLKGRRATDKDNIDGILIKITDSGVGIPEDELEKIFDKFYQSSFTKTGAGGTGLGLAICKEIIDSHRGIIWAENNSDGVGSSFCIEIPGCK